MVLIHNHVEHGNITGDEDTCEHPFGFAPFQSSQKRDRDGTIVICVHRLPKTALEGTRVPGYSLCTRLFRKKSGFSQNYGVTEMPSKNGSRT